MAKIQKKKNIQICSLTGCCCCCWGCWGCWVVFLFFCFFVFCFFSFFFGCEFFFVLFFSSEDHFAFFFFFFFFFRFFFIFFLVFAWLIFRLLQGKSSNFVQLLFYFSEGILFWDLEKNEWGGSRDQAFR